MRMLTLSLLFVMLAATAVAAADQPTRKYFNRPGRAANLPFTDAVLVGDTLYLSGQLGLDPKTGQAPADVEQEARYLLDTIQSVLKESGMDMDDLVYVTVYGTDLSLWERFNAVYRTYFKKEMPARAFLGIKDLLRGARFEIQAVAVKREGKK